MNQRIGIGAIVMLAVCSTMMIGAAAQDDQQQAPLSWVFIDHVKPSMVAQYEEATRDFIKAFQEHNISPEQVSFHTVAGPELGYVYVMQLENFGAIDRMQESHLAIMQSIGAERMAALAARADECVESREVIHTRYRMDLSYEPENPRLGMEEIKYANYSFLRVIPGHEQEFEQIAQDFAALYTEKEIPDPWQVYQVVTGSDLPMYIIADFGKSAADFYAAVEKNEATLGDDAAALMAEAVKHLRKMDHRDGRFRPDLSYPPMEMDGEH